MDFYDSQQHSAPTHDRWMISWADFVTLMFAVFVVLFASATTNKNTAKQVSEAVINALKTGGIRFTSHTGMPVPAGPVKRETLSAAAGVPVTDQQVVLTLIPSLKDLAEKFQDEIAKEEIEIHLESRGVVISLHQAAFFASGEAAVSRDTDAILDKIGDVIRGLPNRVILEGHTDTVPIHNSRFASNWELSAARSIAMLDVLTAREHVPAGRLSIAGYADTAPIESNDDPAGRAHNRRVDVVILSDPVPNLPAALNH
jgi:chemotaxis protein MotB